MGRENTGFTLNGYSYADGKATFNGIELPGVTAFEFKKNVTKVNNYGLGKNPVSRSLGTAEYTGNMEMDFDTQKLLSGISPTGLLTEIPAGIMVLSLERADGGKETQKMLFFEFMSDGLGGSQGDDNLKNSGDVIFGSMTKQSF